MRGPDLSFSASGYKVRGVQHADLSWSGPSSVQLPQVDVYRNGAKVAKQRAQRRGITDSIGAKGGGSYTYKLCGAGAQTYCSNEAVVNF